MRADHAVAAVVAAVDNLPFSCPFWATPFLFFFLKPFFAKIPVFYMYIKGIPWDKPSLKRFLATTWVTQFMRVRLLNVRSIWLSVMTLPRLFRLKHLKRAVQRSLQILMALASSWITIFLQKTSQVPIKLKSAVSLPTNIT